MKSSSAYRYTKDHVGDRHYSDFFRDRDDLGWEEAMDRLIARPDIIKPQKIPVFLSDKRRNDFVFLLPLSRQATVLDFGSGWGNTSFTLSHHCKQVVAMEADAGRLRFSAAHFKHAGANNILPVQSGNARNLPFPDSSFDIVIMNGVLEWTPRSIEGNPNKVHQLVLEEVNRVLKPGGTLAVSIENRFSYKWLTGIRDHHAGGLRWASCIPRWLANIYSWIRLQKPYRAWLYSAKKLRKLFRESGFPDVTIQSYHPNHVTFRYIFGIDSDKNSLRFLRTILDQSRLPWRDRLAYRLAVAGIPYRWIAHDYLAISRKPGTAHDSDEDVLSAIKDHCGAPVDATTDLYSASRSILITASHEDKKMGIGKFPRESRWNDNVGNEASGLAHYAGLSISSDVQVPRIFFSGLVAEKPLVVMSYAPGNPPFDRGEQLLIRPKIRKWLIEIAQKRAPSKYSKEPMPWWNDASTALGPDVSLPPIEPQLENLRGVLIHGDLSPHNVLCGSEGTTIIDWEFSEIDGLPLIDLIDFLLYCQYQESRDYEEAWHKVFVGDDREEINEYCGQLDIPLTLIPALADQFLLKKIVLLDSLEEPVSKRKLAQLISIYKSRLAERES
jgi:ubiquinone/menaquinone biosynthesis C-methylase UbiE